MYDGLTRKTKNSTCFLTVIQVSCRLVKLVLRNNALTSLHGIQNLKSLEEVDLSYNIICTFTDVEILASLSSLHNLWLEGNPICCSQRYRSRVFSFFSNPEKVSCGFLFLQFHSLLGILKYLYSCFHVLAQIVGYDFAVYLP